MVRQGDGFELYRNPRDMNSPEVERLVGKTTTVVLRKVPAPVTGVLKVNDDGTYSAHWPGVREDPRLVRKFAAADIESITPV
jgi:hypothetical protein